MSGWREQVDEALRGRNNRNDRNNSPQNRPIDPIDPNVPAPLDLLREWRGALLELDFNHPRDGFSKQRWLRLGEASEWWFNNFAKQAASDGWSTADIFGICEAREGWGGLLDRLGHSRTLVMDRYSARWRDVFGAAHQFNRGSYPDLPAFWEVSLEASSD